MLTVPPFDRSVHDVIVIILIYEYDKVRSVSTSEECQSSFFSITHSDYLAGAGGLWTVEYEVRSAEQSGEVRVWIVDQCEV